MLALLATALALLAPQDSVVLRVLAMTDLHGALEPRVYRWSDERPVGGIAALKGYMDGLEAECGCPTLRLDAGDQMQGTLVSNLTYGRASIDAMNLLGLDGASLGNHDLDWTVDTLAVRIRQARYPWLVANAFDSTTGRRPPWARPYAVVRAGRFTVGLIGYLTEATKRIVLAENVAGLEFRPGRAAIQDAIAALRTEGVDFTFLLAHAGAFCDSLACRGEIIDLAAELGTDAVQLIVAGHTHSLVNTTIGGIPIVVARANSTALGVIDLVEVGGRREWRARVETVFADRVGPDTAVAALLARYVPEVERLSGRVVATLADSFVAGRIESPLGTLIADAQRAAAGADFAIMNNGGIRRELLPGPVTYGDLFELQPFTNFVVWIAVTGAELREIVEFAIRGERPRAHFSGLDAFYDPNRPSGRRVLALRRDNGRPVDPARTYRLALSNFLAGGGDGYPVVTAKRAHRTGKTDLDALIAWLDRQPKPIRATTHRHLIPAARAP